MAAPRAYWKGSLKLSLVSCPVVLYPATTSVDKTRFHMINKETGNRLKQQMVDSETGDVVESDQKGRGYELKKGEYVEVEKDELEAVQIESNHTIDIDSFVPKDEIDERYINNPYYIAPDGKAGIDAFAVIRDAMKDQGRVALARIVLTNREHIIAIEPWGKGLLGITLRYPYEVRDEDDYFDDIKNPKISKDMVELAGHILDSKAAHFDPSKFKDEYETALKIPGQTQGRRQAGEVGRARGEAGQRHQPDGCAEAKPEGQGSGETWSARSSSAARATAYRQEGSSLDGASAQGELKDRSSCPGLTRASSSSGATGRKAWMAGSSPAMTGNRKQPLLLCLAFPGRFLRRLPFLRRFLRDFLAFRSRLGKPDRDRLLAARDLLAGPAALQCAGLALLHRAPDLGGRLLRIFSCHDFPPSYGKIILAMTVGSSKRTVVRRPPNRVQTYFSRPAIVPGFLLVAASGPLARARRSVRSPRRPAAAARI